MRFAIIDESGRLYDPNDKFVVFAAIVVTSLINLDKIISAARKHLPKKVKIAEIKFSTTGEKTRNRVLHEIYKRRLSLFILLIDKKGRRIKDNPENYSLLVAALLNEVVKKYPDVSHIIIDRHFTWVTQREKFNTLLEKKVGKPLFIEHLDSQQNTIVSLPDFVAGAFRVEYAKNEPSYALIVEGLVEEKMIIAWRQLRQQKR